MEIPRLPKNASSDAVLDALRGAGCVIIEELASPEVADTIRAEIDIYLDQVPCSTGSFLGQLTKRTSSLILKSPTLRDLIIHPLVLSTLDEYFRDECYFYQLHLTEATRIMPGEKSQSLHRDNAAFPFKHPCRPCQASLIWALSDFTAENGGTLVAPGSHEWDDVRKPLPEELVSTEMPKGSLLLYNASVYHGAGANRSDGPRSAVLLSYSLGWLRQMENQFLAVPKELVKVLPPKLQELIGYKNHGYLGNFESQSPLAALEHENVPVVLAAHDLYDEFEHIRVRRR